VLEVYEADREKILKVGITMQRKWDDLCNHKFDLNNPKAHRNVGFMQAWAEEAEKRFEEIGFVVKIDITPAIAGVSTPTISIEERVKPELTDYERVIHEAKKDS
jgi:hypothetical protein